MCFCIVIYFLRIYACTCVVHLLIVVGVSVKPQVPSQPPMLLAKKPSELKPESKPVALTDDHKATEKTTKDGKQFTNART